MDQNQDRRTHLQKVLERMQQQQQKEERLIAQPDLNPPSPPSTQHNQFQQIPSSPDTASKEDVYQKYDNHNNNPQDEVIDYSKPKSAKRRIMQVPTFQTSIFSGEFRNAAELQNFERLLELRYAKRKGKTFTLVDN